jgi:hypothetical protein
MPAEKKAVRLDNLVSVFHESLWIGTAGGLNSLPPMSEPVKKWLTDAYMESLKLSDGVFREENCCNSYLLTTAKGSVIIGLGRASEAGSWPRSHRPRR